MPFTRRLFCFLEINALQFFWSKNAYLLRIKNDFENDLHAKRT